MKINKIVSKFENRIRENIKKTKKDEEEHGFIICENDGVSAKELKGGRNNCHWKVR